MNNSSFLDLEECKIQASILLKALCSDDQARFSRAIKRLRVLPELSLLSEEELKLQAKRKHALAVIAREHGFTSWNNLSNEFKTTVEQVFAKFFIGGFLNQWFATYDEAKQYQHKVGGYLLPYKHQFFICEASYIADLGLDPNDKVWHLINYDWARPTDFEARNRLYKKLSLLKGANHG